MVQKFHCDQTSDLILEQYSISIELTIPHSLQAKNEANLSQYPIYVRITIFYCFRQAKSLHLAISEVLMV